MASQHATHARPLQVEFAIFNSTAQASLRGRMQPLSRFHSAEFRSASCDVHLLDAHGGQCPSQRPRASGMCTDSAHVCACVLKRPCRCWCCTRSHPPNPSGHCLGCDGAGCSYLESIASWIATPRPGWRPHRPRGTGTHGAVLIQSGPAHGRGRHLHVRCRSGHACPKMGTRFLILFISPHLRPVGFGGDEQNRCCTQQHHLAPPWPVCSRPRCRQN